MQENTANVWPYGYTTADSLDAKEFRVDEEFQSVGPIVFGIRLRIKVRDPIAKSDHR